MDVPGTASAKSLAVNSTCTMLAFVELHGSSNRVQILPIPDVIPDVPSATWHEDGVGLVALCFAQRRCGRETILVTDARNKRVVELTTSGAFMREIALPTSVGDAHGVAYSPRDDVVAVAFERGETRILVLHMGNGAVKYAIARDYVEDVDFEPSVTFSQDGTSLFFTDILRSRLHEYEASSGDLSYHINCTGDPAGVLCCDDGGFVVACTRGGKGWLEYRDSAGIAWRTVQLTPSPDTDAGDTRCIPSSLSWFGGHVCYTQHIGSARLVHCEWLISQRCAWVTALTLTETS